MKQIFIYGAGERGKGLFDFFKEHDLDEMIYGFVDRNYDKINSISGKKVFCFDEIKNMDLPFLISFIDPEWKKETEKMLLDSGKTIIETDDLSADFGYGDRVAFSRDICAFLHVNSMDIWFDTCESASEVFWGDDSDYKRMFELLDLTNIIEIACGRGRQTAQYISKAGNVTLVDILQKNIEICRKRFSEYPYVKYYCNNGFNIEQLENEKYTSVFSYDSFVHFELMDIFSYLRDIYRVLVPGGKVLIHHSNNHSDYKASFANAPNGRAFMSSVIFAHISHKCGFKIIEQKEVDWGIKKLDCITLLEK